MVALVVMARSAESSVTRCFGPNVVKNDSTRKLSQVKKLQIGSSYQLFREIFSNIAFVSHGAIVAAAVRENSFSAQA
jgi:hypothetical protein